MQSSSATTWRPGGVVGVYRLVRLLAGGPDDGVYEALAPEGHAVALKLARPFLFDKAWLQAQFEKEQAALASLGLPQFPALIGWGKHEEHVYVVMQLLLEPGPIWPLLDGRPLPVSSRELLALIADAALALDAVHDAGLVHLDLRPGRFFLCRAQPRTDREYEMKVTGFGLSLRRLERVAQRPPLPHLDRADRAFLAPELWRGLAADRTADVFALGAVICALLTGHPPSYGEGGLGSPPELWRPSGDFDSQQMLAVRQVVLRALATEPAHRPPTAGELARELLKVTGHSDQAAAPAQRRTGFFHAAPAQSEPPGPEPRRIDENVQFTVYRPRAIAPARWYDLLAFAHLAERRGDAQPSEPDPLAEVARQAEQMLGEAASSYQSVVTDSAQGIPEAGQLTFVPQVPMLQFEPPARSFRWLETVHCERFRFRAAAESVGQTLRGHVLVLLGRILVAEIAVAVRVESTQPQTPAVAQEAARPYRRIFASYSHKDSSIVAEVSGFARSLGDRYLVDLTELRAGEAWSEGLQQLIRQADVFQLFWSRNSMVSPHVRKEWEHALSLGRPGFVRPTYWEDPMPTAPGLPPEALLRLHFQRLCFSAPPTKDSIPMVAAPQVGRQPPPTMTSSPMRSLRRRRVLPAVAGAAALGLLGLFALSQVTLTGQSDLPATIGPPATTPPRTHVDSRPLQGENPDPAEPATPPPPPTEGINPRPRPPGGRTTRSYERGIALWARGEESEALQAFRRALKQGRLTAQERADAERAVTSLQRRFGELEIVSPRRGARITIDGRRLGRTPLADPIILRPGTHELRVQVPGIPDVRERIVIKAGERQIVRLRLEPNVPLE